LPSTREIAIVLLEQLMISRKLNCLMMTRTFPRLNASCENLSFEMVSMEIEYTDLKVAAKSS
jgi:hypothetical protein